MAVTDLERLTHTARDSATIDAFARQIEPTLGFVVYGVVWLFLSSLPATFALIGGALLGAAVFGERSAGVDVLGFAVGMAGWALAWWPFVVWARRKRARARALARDGIVCDAVVATGTTDRAAQTVARVAMAAAGGATRVHWERLEFEHGGVGYTCVAPFLPRPSNGARAHVLFAPGAKYALAFSPDGSAYVTRVHARASLPEARTIRGG